MSINISTAYHTKINLPYGELNPLLDWCKKNCEEEWKFNFTEPTSFVLPSISDETATTWEFYFESKRDYTNFLLWKK